MFIRVKCPSTINRGDVLSYDATSQQWTPSADGSTIIGVARTDAEERDDNGATVWSCEAVFSGVTWARAHEALVDQGGELAVVNGGVRVAGQNDGRRVVLPKEISAPARVAGDLVRVNLR